MQRVTLALALVLATASSASAHQSSLKLVGVELEGRRVTVTIRLAPGDVTEPLGLPPDATPTAQQALTPGVAAYVQRWLALKACTTEPPTAKLDDDPRFVAVSWSALCERTDVLVVDLDRFFELDDRHTAMISITGVGIEATSTPVRAGESPVTIHVGDIALAAWIRLGMHHIYEGRDHISFVLALLLVVMLVLVAGSWQIRAVRPMLKSTGLVITAFTVGHSISLIAASLGWVDLPSRVVESLIAISIAYTAIENILHPDVRWRFALTFAFGLVHGLGFASLLAELLPADRVIVPLLCFNIGVEVGQLTIVAVALPVFYLVARRLGAERYRRVVMPALSSVIVLLGIIWIIERIAAVTILGM